MVAVFGRCGLLNMWVVVVGTHCCGSSQTQCGGLVTSESPLLPTQRPVSGYSFWGGRFL